MRKRAAAAVGMGITLFYGCLFLFYGAWIYLSGYGTRPARLEFILIGLGVSIIIIGTIIVYADYKKQEEKEQCTNYKISVC
jgi:hypothetical protein